MKTKRKDCRKHEIGKRIKCLRNVFELTQIKMGKIVGAGSTTVSNWETGRQNPTIEQASDIADYLGVTLDYIFLGRVSAVRHDLAINR